MHLERSAGILLHPTSLPGPYGIGDLGPEAHRFLAWLQNTGCRYWQVLPLGPTGYGNSPYQCHSVFAGNPYLISPDLLIRDGFLKRDELQDPPVSSGWSDQGAGWVDYGRLIPWKLTLLQTAFANFEKTGSLGLRSEFARFWKTNARWLEDYCLFMALKNEYQGQSLVHWPAAIRRRRAKDLAQARRRLKPAIQQCAFDQWLFFRQWAELRQQARRRNVFLIGDAPIFAAQDSADVWANPNLFFVDRDCAATLVAGVPPDYFAPTGQLWGNPLYDWRRHKESGFRWWIQRLRAVLGLVDFVRLDHFRGLAGYWEIPAGATTAEAGRWVPGPADILMQALVRALAGRRDTRDLPLIAEDLGVATPDVPPLLTRYRLPGMTVLQFGFAGLQDEFLPHNYVGHCVAYTGTHDNDTARGWFSHATDEERRSALEYLDSSDARIVQDMIRAVWGSRASLAIAPLQDFLELGSEARMNFPGKPEGFWEWRLRPGCLTEGLSARLRSLNEETDRLGRTEGETHATGLPLSTRISR